MTDPIVVIEPTQLSAEPGGQARVEVTVRNPGTIVENYRIEVLSEVAGKGPDVWAQVHPDELSVYPREKGTAIVVLSPPAGLGASSGTFPFGVRVVSTVPPHASAVAEGDLEVGRVFGLQAAITPMTSSGRWRGRHLLKYTNWGNAPVRLRLSARDPDERLGFLLVPDQVDVPLGGSATAALTARTRKPFLRGTPVRLPFEVVAEPDQPGPAAAPPTMSVQGDPRRPVLNGAMTQKPILSRVTVAVAALGAVAVAGAVLLAVKAPKPQPAALVSSLPDPPTGVAAKAESAHHVEVTWQLVQNVPTYQVITTRGGVNVNSAKVQSPTQVFEATNLRPHTVYCFAVQSMRDATHVSSASRLTCLRTPTASPATGSGVPSSAPPSSSGAPSSGASSPATSSSAAASSTSSSASPSGSGSPTSSNGVPVFGPSDYVVLIGTFRGPGAQQTAQAEAVKVISQGFTPNGVLNTADYKNVNILGVGPVVHQFWAVYAGPFDENTARAQQTSCTSAVGDLCTVAQPGPLR
jgi:hypothetical protein